ncbi:MAG: hypothetical protein ABSD57_13265 [Verrucomicrobiota bacterium]|jgi:hypothetical protein
MNICSIGRGFDGIKQIDFSSSQTILDFDAVFIDFVGLFREQGIPPEAILFRREEFLEFLTLGRTIVVFTAPMRLETYLPIKPTGLKTISGSRVDFKGPDHLKIFWQSVQSEMQFLAYFGTAPGQPFLFVSATNKPVATLVKHERGTLLILPWLKWSNYPADDNQRSRMFTAAFEKLNEVLAPKKPNMNLPSWSTNYGWQRECELRTDLVSFQKKADEISNHIKTKTLELENEDKLKVLFVGRGDVLVDTVIGVLKELGAKATAGEPGRDDVILEFERKHAVIEGKGKKGSAAESDAAQLEKWVAGFKEERGVDPKGILLVNAYCETPLAERTEPAFPHQMLKYSTQRDHCLMTTTQLLGLLLEARAHPAKRVDLVNSLWSTVGIYPQFTDWQKFLIAPPPAPAKAS